MARLEDLRIAPSDTPPPRRTAGWVAALAALVLLAAGAYFAWRHLSTTEAPVAAGRAAAVELPPVVEASRPAGGFTAGGYVEVAPPNPAIVTSPIAGRVAAIHVLEGDSVTAGQVLLQFDESVQRQERAEAEAQVALARARLERMQVGPRLEEIAEAEARLAQARAALGRAEDEAARQAQLVALGAAPAKREVESRSVAAAAGGEVAAVQAMLDLRHAGARPEDVAVARAELAAVEAAAQRAQWRLDACTVRAAQDGVVLERHVRVGEWVAPGGEGRNGGALLALYDPRQVQVWVEVNQRDAHRVRVGQVVTVTGEALTGPPLAGRVARILPQANLQRNTLHLKIALAEVPDGLRPGLGVQVTFQPEGANVP